MTPFPPVAIGVSPARMAADPADLTPNLTDRERARRTRQRSAVARGASRTASLRRFINETSQDRGQGRSLRSRPFGQTLERDSSRGFTGARCPRLPGAVTSEREALVLELC